MTPGLRLVDLTARLLLYAYPRAFRAAHREAFRLIAADRWQRERLGGAGSVGATVRTLGLLTRDTWTGVGLVARAARSKRDGRARAGWLDRRGADLRWAVRTLARAPLLTGVATLSLSLGIGATAAVTAATRALLLAPPSGVTDARRLVDICRTTNGSGCDTLGYPTFLDYRRAAHTLSDVCAQRFEVGPFSLSSADGGQLVYGAEVSANYFAVLGATPALGRFFSTTDPEQTPLREAVVSHAYWHDHLGADPAIVGRTVELNGDPYALMGVAAAGFEGTSVVRPDFWLPLTGGGRGLPSADLLHSRDSLWVVLVGRLAPGATRAQAQAEADVVMGGLRAAHPGVYGHRGLAVLPSERMPAALVEAAPFLAFLMALVVTILGVACANLAGLLLARATERARELAVRRALGATRGALVAMCLVETAVLFAPGLALAFLVAPLALGAIAHLADGLPIPVDGRLPVDAQVAVVTVAIALGLAALTAIAPAWQAIRLADALKEDASAPRRQRLRHLFVAAQIAFCLVSIVLASLLLRAVAKGTAVDPGFRVQDVEVAQVDLGLGHYGDADAARATAGLEAALAALPGVERVGAASLIPLEGNAMGFGDLRPAGDRDRADLIDASWSLVSPTYFATLGIPIVRGRGFTEADRADGPRHAVVNETFAARVWPGRDPVGQTLETGDFRPGHDQTGRRVTVVGIARNAKYKLPGEPPTAFIYVPLAEEAFLAPTFFLAHRPGLNTATLASAVRQTLARADRTLPLVAFAPLSTYTAISLLPQRIAAAVAATLGLLALGLAAVGLYGLTAFTVTTRTRELGLRVALGATGGQVLRFVVWQGLRMAALGAAAGAVVAALASHVAADVLFGVSPLDPVAFGGALGTVAVIALVATALPARRAVSVSPIVALRSE